MDGAQAVFVRTGDHRVVATALSGGPWSSQHMHGGAPAALIAWAAEKIDTPVPMRIGRITVEMLRPAPMGEVTVEQHVIRQGRTTQACEIRLLTGNVEVTRGHVLKIASAAPEPQLAGRMPVLGADHRHFSGLEPRGTGRAAFNSIFEIRDAAGATKLPGRGQLWFRQRLPLIAQEEASPAVRATAVGDFTNGISSVVDIAAWTFLSCDLTVHLGRDPQGEWIYSDAQSWVSEDGIGIATARLADEAGFFGCATQTTMVRRRPE